MDVGYMLDLDSHIRTNCPSAHADIASNNVAYPSLPG